MKAAAAVLTLALCLGAAARAEEEPAAPEAPAWSDHGFEYGLHLGVLSVFNGSPLDYGPIDLGWRFANGARVRTGLSLFYYRGDDSDGDKPTLGVEPYYYEMLDWRLSVEYVVPLPFPVRPVTGLSVDFISGSRSRSVAGVTDAPKLGAWGMVAPGALLGLDWRFAQHASTDLQLRYSNGFTAQGPVVSTDWTWRYLF